MGVSYDPWEHARDLEIDVIEDSLPIKWRGAYYHDDRQIILVPGMSHREARCTLAHEIQHGIYGDVMSPFGPLKKFHENRARFGAAKILVSPDEYAHYEKLHDFHFPSIAHSLNVTLKILQDWQHFHATKKLDFEFRF